MFKVLMVIYINESIGMPDSGVSKITEGSVEEICICHTLRNAETVRSFLFLHKMSDNVFYKIESCEEPCV